MQVNLSGFLIFFKIFFMATKYVYLAVINNIKPKHLIRIIYVLIVAHNIIRCYNICD